YERRHQTLEAESDGPGIETTLGGVLARQGRNVCAHRYQTGSVVRGERRQQEMRPAQRNFPPVVTDCLRRSDAGTAEASAAGGGQVRPAAHARTELCAGSLQVELLRH